MEILICCSWGVPPRQPDVFDAFFSAAWGLGFSLTGRLARPETELWTTAGGQRVLAIATHPDDEAIGCAGAILLHKRSGDEVVVAYITDGRASRALGLGPEEMAARRRAEAEACASVLGVDRMVWFGVPEGDWRIRQLQPQLKSLLQRTKPHVVYAPSRIDFHMEHRKLAQALSAPLDKMDLDALGTRMRIYQAQTPLTPVLTNLLAPISEVEAEVRAALSEYRTQQDNIPRALRMRRYAALYYGVGGLAEPFWQITVRDYCRLHSGATADQSAEGFRGLRARPFSDPLAYLRGVNARRRLSSLAGIEGAEVGGGRDR